MLSELDINLLESYLDDALSASEVQALDARLSEEPEVAAALDALRNERAARVTTFQAMTPDAPHADRFAREFLASVRRRELYRRLVRGAKIIGSMAACLAFGLAAGWMGRGHGNAKIADAGHVTPYTIPTTQGSNKPADARAQSHQTPSTGPNVAINTQIDLKTAQSHHSATAKSQDALAAYGLAATEVTMGNRWGIYIDSVKPNSPADKARLMAGDLLLAAAGAPVTDIPAFAKITAQSGKAELLVLRGNEVIKVVADFQQR